MRLAGLGRLPQREVAGVPLPARVGVLGVDHVVEPLEVLGAGVAGVVEGVVDDDSPGVGAVDEVVVRQPGAVADVAEHEVDPTARAPPDDLVRVGTLDVLAAELHPEAVTNDVLEQLAATPFVVLPLGALDDRLVDFVEGSDEDDGRPIVYLGWGSMPAPDPARMIELARAAGAQVLLLGMKMPPNYGPKYTTGFETIYATLAKQNRLPFVPFFLEKIALAPGMLQADGLHPTAAAQPAMLDAVWPTLLPLLRRAGKG